MNARTSLSCIVALGAALSAPLVFAQDADPATSAQETATAAQETQAMTPAAAEPTEAKQVSWSDLDADKDGNLNKTEAASIPSLNEVFDQADADTDGALTPDEYKNYIAKNGTAAPAPRQEG